MTNRLLIEASGIHRVERWGGMHLQTGKGENIDAIAPGMISVTDNPNPVTGGSLTYRSAAQYNNSWNWNIHYRAAVLVHHRLAQLQGRLQQRLPPSREHDLHRSERAVQLHLRERRPDADHVSDRASNHRGQRGLRLRRVRAGPLDDRPMDAAGRHPLRRVREQLPGAVDRSHGARAERSTSSSTEIDNLNVEGHHAQDGRDLRPVR